MKPLTDCLVLGGCLSWLLILLLHLFVSHYYIRGYYEVQTTSAVDSLRHLICHLWTLRRFVHTACALVYIFTWRLECWLERHNFCGVCCSWRNSTDEPFYREKHVCYYMSMNSSPCHCTYLCSFIKYMWLLRCANNKRC